MGREDVTAVAAAAAGLAVYVTAVVFATLALIVIEVVAVGKIDPIAVSLSLKLLAKVKDVYPCWLEISAVQRVLCP